MKLAIPVAQPPWTQLGRRLESMTRKALYEYEMGSNKELAIALSGGKDSLTLLFLLAAIKGRGFPDWNLHAIHITGAFSCGAGVDRGYLRAVCNELNVSYHEREAQQELATLECYSCSRQRRSLLFEVAREVGATEVAFGHHRDDHAQTLLMNLLHKGEFAGLLPKVHMAKYEVTILRPLIFVSEEEIRQFAQLEGFARVMCKCPVGATSRRRKVEEILSDLEHEFPEVRANLARAGLLYGSQKAATP